jgi:hypothetical protein
VQQDSSQVSGFGKLMKQLESLQQSDPEKFKATAAQIADKLESAAKEAAATGDSQQASALNDLASKFKTASETGKMPDLRPPGDSDGVRHAGGHHGGRPHMGPPPSDDDSTSSTTNSSTDATSSIAELLSSYRSQSTDPMSVLAGILTNVFSSAQTSGS